MRAVTRILAATDFSPAAERAMRRAALIAKRLGAELHLLHVVHPLHLYPGQEIDAGPLDEAALAAAGERLGPLADRLAEHYAIPTRAVWRIGRAYSRIAEYARDATADLVVVGAHGENTLLRLVLGSTTQRLLGARSGPTLIVRNAAVVPYRRVLAAVDFRAGSRATLDWVRRVADEARVDAVHVLDPAIGLRLPAEQREPLNAEMRGIAQSLMDSLLADTPGERAGHVETGHPSARLLELAQDWRCDLIAVGRRGQGGIEEFLLGSVCKAVAQAADCDVLVTDADAPA